MPCNITGGFGVLDCRNSVGGISTAYIANFSSVDSLTISSGGTVDNISMSGFFYEYKFRRNTGSFKETITVSDENASVFYAPEVVLQFSRMEAFKRTQIQLLSQADVMIIILDNNGKYWLAGSSSGLTLTAGDADAGKAKGDFNGYHLTFTGQENYPMLEVPPSVIADVIES